MKIKECFNTLLCLCLAFLLAGCALSKDKKVAIFYSDTNNDEYTENLSAELDTQLTKQNVVYESFTADSNQKLQTEQIEKEVKNGAGILVVNMADNLSEFETKNVVKIASKADVPLVFFGRPINEDLLESYSKSVYIGADYIDAQKVQGEMIGNYLVDNYELIDLNGDGKISYIIFPDNQMKTNSTIQPNVEEADRILAEAGKPAIEYYNSSSEFVYYKDGDNINVYNHMSVALSHYNPQNNNMIELVIAERDEWALCALEALKDTGYNQVRGTRIIPLFGMGATIAAQNALYGGMMTGTVRQDSERMAEIIEKVCTNMLKSKEKFRGVDEKLIKGKNRIDVPYSQYYGRNTM